MRVPLTCLNVMMRCDDVTHDVDDVTHMRLTCLGHDMTAFAIGARHVTI